ncbi:MAG: YdcF family protein [Boseongicola sp.]
MTNAHDDPFQCEKAVIVLGHEMNCDGVPDEVGLARLGVAADEVRRDPGAVLVTSGWAYRDDTKLSLAEAMANAAIRLHRIADENIIGLNDAHDTVGDAVFFARSIRANFTCVVTSEYHQARANRVFRFVLGKDAQLSVLGLGGEIAPDTTESEAASLAAFAETFRDVPAGDLDAIYSRMMEKHPFYNGTRDSRAARRHD